MRIGVISDTHIPARAKRIPQEALDAFAGADLILHAGDLTELGALAPLESIARVVAVRGNMDSPAVCRKFEKRAVVEADGVRIGMTHGAGSPASLQDRVRKQFEDERADVIVFGHSHQAFADWVDGVYMFNPGSPTDDVYARERSVGILNIGADGVRGRIVRLP